MSTAEPSNVIPFPAAVSEVSGDEALAHAEPVKREAKRFTRPKVPAPLAYRVRKAPGDVVRLSWFALRGHGRWTATAWHWVSHGDLRADVRAARATGDVDARRAARWAIRSPTMAYSDPAATAPVSGRPTCG